MRKIFITALLPLAVLLSCKKDNSKNNNALTGEWKLQYTHYSFIADDNRVLRDTDVDDSKGSYIKFNNDGTGVTNIDEPMVTNNGGYSDVVVNGKFKYKMTENSLTLNYDNAYYPLVRNLSMNGGDKMIVTLQAKASKFAMSGYSSGTSIIIEHYSK